MLKNKILFALSTFLLVLILQQIVWTQTSTVSATVTPSTVTTVANKGNGVLDLIGRFKLTRNMKNVEYFQKINAGSFDRNGGLLLGNTYVLPIKVVKFDGKTIRSTLNITDFDLAKRIENYNIEVEQAKLKKGHYKNTKELWVPFEILLLDSNFADIPKTQNRREIKPDYSFLKDEKINKTSKDLEGMAFYIIAGHGGPDPGAIGNRDGFELHEHEYAYDVSARLAKRLIENGADVYMIIQDPNDGIRDEQILKNGGNERMINSDAISPIQIERLKQRTAIVNDYSQRNSNKYKHQALIEIHVDSRVTDKRIDIFFYHRSGCARSAKLNKDLLSTIEEKYKIAQPNRGYSGTVSARDLYTLRNTTIPATFIELGNIQNPADQIRIIQPNNRQAIANWLCDGIIKHFGKK